MRKALTRLAATAAVALGLTAPGAQAQLEAFFVDRALFKAPQDGGLRRWQVAAPQGLTLRATPGGQTTGPTIANDAIVTNFGCTDVKGDIWCEVRPMHGGPKGFAAAIQLHPVAGPDGVVATGPNESAKRAKRKQFDATATIRCAQEQGETLKPCQIGVARSDGGDATAAVTFENGFTRLLFFMHGEFVSASATMSGVGRDTDWQLLNGMHRIRADDQQFEIPHAFLFTAE